MTGAVTVSAVVGLLSLFAGVALGWYLRSGNDGCSACIEQDQLAQADGAMPKMSREGTVRVVATPRSTPGRSSRCA